MTGFALADAPRAMGTLALTSSTLGAEVFIDGDSVGTTPLKGTLTLTADEHTLKVVKPGYAPLIDVVKIARRKTTKLDIDLTPVAGILRVKANIKESRVFVDGKFVGEAPLEAEISVGARGVLVSRAGYKDFFQNVEAVAGQEIALEVQLDELPPELNPYKPKAAPPPKWYDKWWVWTAGVAGVAIVVTAVAVPVALSQRDPVKAFDPSYTYTVTLGK
ncbi:MAG: PEGA domain-containing protein [Polyangia bacterium]